MSEIHVVPKDMKTSITIAEDAERDIRKADSAGHLSKAGGAIPGAESVGYLSDLGTRWESETNDAADDAQDLASEMEKALHDFQTTDAGAGAAGRRVMGPN